MKSTSLNKNAFRNLNVTFMRFIEDPYVRDVQLQPAHNSHPIKSRPNQIPVDQFPPKTIPTRINSYPYQFPSNQFPPESVRT